MPGTLQGRAEQPRVDADLTPGTLLGVVSRGLVVPSVQDAGALVVTDELRQRRTCLAATSGSH